MHGKSVKLFYPNGSVEGIVAVELMNHTGVVYACPRTQLSEFNQQAHTQGVGIYFLINSQARQVYVGETTNGVLRIRNHNEQLTDWDHLIFIGSKDQNINKAHCIYLEHKAWCLIQGSSYTTVNKKELTHYYGDLSPFDRSAMNEFLEGVSFMLSSVGYTILKQEAYQSSLSAKPIEEFELKTGTVEATAYLQDGNFVLRKGSYGNPNTSASLYDSIKQKRESLIKQGLLVSDGTKLMLQEDYATDITSNAACILTGSPISGPRYWKHKVEKVSYSQWEQSRLALEQ